MTLDVIEKDFPEQFRRRKNDVICKAFDRQMQEVSDLFTALETAQTIEKASGKQLDCIGDIVGLTRFEAAAMISNADKVESLDDAYYRKMLLYQILRNRCDCTYYDVIKSVNMLWDGPKLKYTEDPEQPATIIFDFDSKKELGERISNMPFVKAGGVGVLLRMHRTDETTFFAGFAVRVKKTITIECNTANPVFVTDEDGKILVDENGSQLTE